MRRNLRAAAIIVLAMVTACSESAGEDRDAGTRKGDGSLSSSSPGGDASGADEGGASSGSDGDAGADAGSGSAPTDASTNRGDAPPGCDPGSAPGLTLVDLGDEGLSPGDSIDAHLQEHFEQGNYVVIPEGEYEWSGQNIGGSFDADAVLCGDGEVVLSADDGAKHHGTVSVTGDATVRIENLTLRGVASEGKNRIAFQGLSSDARIEVVNVSHPDGSPHDGHPSPIGFFVRSDHEGEVLLKDCYIANFPNNGLYVSGHSGHVTVDGCEFEANEVDNLRLTGVDEARNVLVRMNGGEFDWDGRGIRFRYPGDEVRLENVHVVNTETGASPIQTATCGRLGDPVNATLKDVFIRNEGGSPAIDMKCGDAAAENVHITGGGDLSTPSVSGDVCRGDDCTEPLTDIEDIRARGRR